MLEQDVNIEELTRAREILGIPEVAPLSLIKERFRALCHQYHPDRNPDDERSAAKMAEINKAYELILDYCRNYWYSFKANEATGLNDWWQERFGEDPLWGSGPKKRP